MRHAQGNPEKTDFSLTADNIDQYLEYAVLMDRDVRWFNSIDDLQYKLRHPESVKDELYTPEYIARRLAKLEDQRVRTPADAEVHRLKEELRSINSEISEVRPLVFDLELGKDPAHHERMSNLDDRRKSVEDQIDMFYQSCYPKLHKNLPKIYYMIVEGVDMSTVNSCFRQMKDVLLNKTSIESAAEKLMEESVTKYNLPAGIWDPIKNRGGRGKGKK